MGHSNDAPTRVEIGRRAERLAALYLELRGYRLVEQNLRHGPREIDLIVHRAGVCAIVEVRFRSRSDFGSPEETVRFRKRRDLLRAGRAYWLSHGRALGRLRFDLITVRFGARGLRLRHWQAFLSAGAL